MQETMLRGESLQNGVMLCMPYRSNIAAEWSASVTVNLLKEMVADPLSRILCSHHVDITRSSMTTRT